MTALLPWLLVGAGALVAMFVHPVVGAAIWTLGVVLQFCSLLWQSRWVQRDWWVYLFSDLPEHDKLRRVVCRIRGHPKGEIYFNFNPEATEPDHRCRTCDEDIG